MINRLLVIGFVWPEPDSSAAGSRIIQLIKQFQNQGYQIVFASAASKSVKSFDLESIGVETSAIQLNHQSFNEFIEELNPQIVLFDRFMTEEQFGWRVAESCPDAVRILDMEDFHGLRKGRELAVKAGRHPTLEDLQNQVAKREIASIYRCDISLVISQAEMQILTVDFNIPSDLLLYLPFLISPPKSDEKQTMYGYDEREHFMTIGNFLHPPNYDAVVFLKSRIWPLIRTKLPLAELHIYGAYDSQKVLQLTNKEDGFYIKGFTEDVEKSMQKYRVCLAPLRFGAGLKGKLVDALLTGTPCVMSLIAGEGIFDKMEPNGYVSDKPEEFAQNAVALYNNRNIWKQMQTNGFQVLENRFDKNAFEQVLDKNIENLRNHLKQHRQSNFIGQILQLKSLQSTKYMSKWIEEKNKLKSD